MSIGGSSDDRLAKVSNGRSLLRVMLDAPRVSLVQCTCNGFVHVTCCNSLTCMQAPCPHRQQSIRSSSTLGKIQHLPSPCLLLCRRAGAPPPPPPHPNWKPGQPPPPPGLGLGSKTPVPVIEDRKPQAAETASFTDDWLTREIHVACHEAAVQNSIVSSSILFVILLTRGPGPPERKPGGTLEAHC